MGEQCLINIQNEILQMQNISKLSDSPLIKWLSSVLINRLVYYPIIP
jgi:hypothetical protein